MIKLWNILKPWLRKQNRIVLIRKKLFKFIMFNNFIYASMFRWEDYINLKAGPLEQLRIRNYNSLLKSKSISKLYN